VSSPSGATVLDCTIQAPPDTIITFGTLECWIPLAAGSEVGQWNVNWVYLADELGNNRTYTGTDLSAVDTTITVTP
jgi:hypothetical protein